MTNAEELIERLEKATLPARTLDCEIAVAVGWFKRVQGRKRDLFDYVDVRDGKNNWPGHGGDDLVPMFTRSIDRAVTLVPEGFAWTLATQGRGPFTYWCSVAFPDDDAGSDQGRSPTAAIALCIAALKARQQSQKEITSGD